MKEVEIRLENDKTENDIERVIDAIEAVADTDFVTSTGLFADDFKKIISRLRDKTFRLAVVGEFSSGKSTFLNALMGKDLLKHGAQETTATITEIENVLSNETEGVFDVYYTDGKKKTDVPISLLAEYTVTTSKMHSVAQEIEKVNIKSHILDIDSKLSFVDTPGLNGIADKHREKTIEQIKNAHACVYLLQVRGIGQSDIDFIRFISKYQHNFIFVQNFIDELKALEGETPEEKLEEQSRILKEKVFQEIEGVNYEIVAISARKALLARDMAICSYEGMELSLGKREQLLKESGFQSVLDEISKLMMRNEKGRIQRLDTINVAVQLLDQLYEIVTLKKQEEKAEWEQSREAKKERNYQIIISRMEEDKSQYISGLTNYIEAEAAEIRRGLSKKISEGLQSISDDERRILEFVQEIPEMEAYMNGSELPNFLNDRIFKVEDECNHFMRVSFENLLSNALSRMMQYLKSDENEKKISIPAFSFSGISTDEKYDRFEQEENRIDKIRNDISREEMQLKEKRGERAQKEMEERRIMGEIQQQKALEKINKSQKDSRIAGLGSMPEAVTKYRTEIDYKYRGNFWDTLCGPKKVEYSVPYLDTTVQNAWIKRKMDIMNQFQTKEGAIKRQISSLELRLSQCQGDLESLDRLIPKKQQELETMQKYLKSTIDYVKVQKEYAKKEYLRNLKNNVMENVDKYLFENIRDCMTGKFEEAVCEDKHNVTDQVIKSFERLFAKKISKLKEKMNGIHRKAGTMQTDELIHTITQTKKILEEYTCQ